jgi:arabinofuranan 3-O-arabinosyltransferase
VRAPEGRATWLKVEILDAESARPGLSGAGFSEVSVPGVEVTRLLALPADAERTDAAAHVISLHRGTDPGGLAPAVAESGLHRQFHLRDGAGAYDASLRAVAVPGDALDRLLDRLAPQQRRKIAATADSTGGTGGGARNLVDGDLTTAWIGGDRPVIHLSWPGRTKIDEIVLGAAGGLSARPEQVRISSPGGTRTAAVDSDGVARFDALTTDRLDLTVTRTAPLTLYNPVADERLQLPVGLSELYVPALADLRAAQPDPDARFSLPCGQGPTLDVDGTPHATKASGLVRDLTERRPVKVELCDTGPLQLAFGRHRVESTDTGALALTDVTLTQGAPAALSGTAGRAATVREWTGDSRTVSVSAGSGAASYLRTYENVNDGWKATLNGEELTPLRLDGWQQAWLIPAGQSGTVHLEYEPARVYRAGLIGGVAGVAALVALALVGRRRAAAEPSAPTAGLTGEHPTSSTGSTTGRPMTSAAFGSAPPAPGPLLGVVALTLVTAVVAGPLALVVPLLAVVARRRPGVLVPVAGVAMAAAGVVAATGAGGPVAEGAGAFGATAQALALVALCAAVVTTGSGRGRR